MEDMAKGLYFFLPGCPEASLWNRSYYVATAGPTPLSRKDIVAYEVSGDSWQVETCSHAGRTDNLRKRGRVESHADKRALLTGRSGYL